MRIALLTYRGNMFCGGQGIYAAYLAREFDGKFTTGDIIQLPNFNVYLRLMIDGVSSRGFSAKVNIR